MNQPFSISRAIYDEIVAHAREGKPEEICGVLRGRGNLAFALHRGINIAEDRALNYTVDPQTLLLQFHFEEAGDEMVAVYHSHPVSVAYPSATDAWNAFYPEIQYVICSLEFDDAPVIRTFRLVQQLDHPLDWASIRTQLPFFETRPGLFAWYQPAGEPLPIVLDASCKTFSKPFYLLYSQTINAADQLSNCLVTVHEHPLLVEG